MNSRSPAKESIMLGSLFLGGAAILFPIKDAFVKSLGGTISAIETAAAYFAVQATLTLLWHLYKRSMPPLQPIERTGPIVIARSVFMVLAIVLFFGSIQAAPLAEAVVLFTTNTLFVVLLGGLLLRERIGLMGIGAVVLGFVGVLFIMQPTASNLPNPYLLLALGSAIAYASFMIATRKLGQTADPVQMLLFDGVLGTILCVAVLVTLSATTAFEATILGIGSGDAMRLVAAGSIGTISAILVIWAMRKAPASRIASWGYLEIPSAVVVGAVVFDEHIDAFSVVGGAIIVFACYLASRDSKCRNDHARSLSID